MNGAISGNGAQIDRRGLQELYKKSPEARSILDHLANRQRDWNETTVDRLQTNVAKAGVELSRSEVVDVLRALEAAGCGDFVVGRRGKSSRFVWRSSLVGVGRLAAGEPVAELELAPAQGHEEEESETVEHQYHLRPGSKPVILRLPADLTPIEAGRLAEFVRTLPFEQIS
jgi:hypothetical protein